MHADDRKHNLPPEKEFSFSNKEFDFLAGLAHAKSGIMLTAQKKDMVYGRLVRRLRALEIDSFADYCEFLQTSGGDEEMGNFVNAITTNLTSFFRENHHFEHLASVLAARRDGPSRKLRLWSAACSSGMEPYSMAMVLGAAIPQIQNWDALILATDIDSNMVKIGAAGEYLKSDVDDVSARYAAFVQDLDEKRVRMADKIKQLVRFRELNLLEEWPMRSVFDAVFCRNVVIYFNKPTKEVLFDRMADAIAPGGFLYIGHSESLNGITDRFKLVGRTIYQRVK